MSRKPKAKQTGLTLIEILVVVAVLALLAALLIPALGAAKEGAIRTKCLSNMKQLALGLIAYGNENRGRQLVMQPTNWLWDLPLTVEKTANANGAVRNTYYDPGCPEQNNDELWNLGLASSRQPFRVIGYALTFPGTGSLIASNQNRRSVSPATTLDGEMLEPVPNVQTRVLAAGIVISQPGQNDLQKTTSCKWATIPGPYSKPLRSSHLDRSGKLPTGDNVAMLDGSGQWINFKNMKPRTQGAGPVFWW